MGGRSTRVDGEPGRRGSCRRARSTLAFEDGQASGRAACNSYGGAYDAGDDGSLSFEGFAVTEMACEPPLMTLESAYLEALGRSPASSVDGTAAALGDGTDLTFDEEVPPVALPLVGTTWTLTTSPRAMRCRA